MASSLEAVLRAQATSNRNAARHAELYAGHRARLTEAIAALPPGAGRLCLLGAGRCLDVDLAALAARLSEVHLVDLDADAVSQACAAQPAEVRARLFRHAPVDLSGVLRHLDRLRRNPPTLAELDALVAPAVDGIARALPGPFDAVVSCCLATQLSRAVTQGLGPDHPAGADVRRRVLAIHLRSMIELLRPDGEALFASDLVSNETYPLEELGPEADLAKLVADLIRDGNFFFGADPALLSQVLRRDPVLARRAAPARPLAPWLWRAAPDRLFLVHAFRFARRAEPSP